MSYRIECGVILRRHTPAIREFNEAWWDEVCRHSRRDQLSFNYVARKLGLPYAIIEGSVHTTPYFPRRDHLF